MRFTKSSTRLLLAGWLLVAGWFVATPGLLPLAFAAVAWIDGEHDVEVRGAGEVVSVVLTHGAQNAGKTHGQIHQHKLLGQVLTCYARTAGEGADHVMSFAGTSVLAIERKAAVESAGEEVEAVAPTVDAGFVVIEIPAPTFSRRLVEPVGEMPLGIPARRHALLI